ncbi:Glycosyl transferase group 1 (fragment) [Mesorhizobium sp. SOD10]
MDPYLVCIGGEDHRLRIPFVLSLRKKGFRLTAIRSGDATAFLRHEIPHRRIELDRFAVGSAQLSALRSVRGLMAEARPDIIQSFDTKPNLLTPSAVRCQVPVVRTINGLGWTFSLLEPRAPALRPVFCSLQWLASLWTAATVFQNRNDRAFERWWLTRKGMARLIAGSGNDVGAFAAASHFRPTPRNLARSVLEFHRSRRESLLEFVRSARQRSRPGESRTTHEPPTRG